MTSTDRDLLRRTLIRILCAHRDTPFTIPVIIERLTERLPDRTFDEDDVQDALAFLEGMFLAREIPSPYQGPPKWQIKQEGLNFHARNG